MSKRLRLLILLASVSLLILAAPAGAYAVPTYVNQFGSLGAGNGQLNYPFYCTADGLGHIWVSDYSNNRMEEFNVNGAGFGNYITQYALAGAAGSTMNLRNQSVASWTNGTVTLRTLSGSFIATVGAGSSGSGNGQFVDPMGVAFDRFGFIYVVDSGNNRVEKFYPNGVYLTKWGSLGSSAGQFSLPYGIAVDSLGNVYVTDTGNNRIQKFSSSGGYISQWGSLGSSAGQFSWPNSIDIGQNNSVYVTDRSNNRVQYFTPTGGYLGQFGSLGSGNGQFSGAVGVSSDGMGIYATDLGNNRVEKFSLASAKATTRLGGSDRYGVAVGMAKSRWGASYTGIHNVIVVCGEDAAMADPLAAGGLAGIWDGPILMTHKLSLPTVTKQAIQGMRANNGPLAIHVVGGTGSVPGTIYNQIKALNPGGTIERISGVDRYDLSAQIARKMVTACNAKGVTIPYVLLFNGQNPAAFYDALAASPLSAGGFTPMLALRNTSVPGPVGNVLVGPLAGKLRLVVNSTAYCPASLYTAAGAAARLSTNQERSASAVQIATYGRLLGLVGLKNVAITNKLPDSLCGGAYVGEQGGVLLYSNTSSLPLATQNFLAILKIGSQQGYVFGGQASITDGTVANFNTILNTP